MTISPENVPPPETASRVPRVAVEYLPIAIQLEERDLIASLGDDYRDYRRRVPMLIPFTRTKGGSRASSN